VEEARRVVKALMRVGPRLTEISKATGVPISTVRYILQKRLPKLGLSVHASINYGALGLQRYLVRFKGGYPAHYISRLLDIFGESFYLDYYTYLMTDKEFLAVFALPPIYEKEFFEFLSTMEALGLIESPDVCRLTYMRPLPFMAEFFDFSNGVWVQDWVNRTYARDLPEAPEYPVLRPRIDRIDLMILSELQENAAAIKYTEFARRLGVSRQTISKHFKHVKRLINFYTVFWFPPMNPELVISPIIVKTKAERDSRRTLLSVPFAFNEFRSERGEYYAMLLIPSVGLYSTLKFLHEHVSQLELEFQDMEYSGKFALQYELFKEGSWINVFETAVDRLIEIIQKKESSGRRLRREP